MEYGIQQSNKHSKSTFVLSFSKLFERTSFYGLRSILVLYLTSEAVSMSIQDALSLYGWLGTSGILLAIIGGFLGDLVIGNKKATLIGGVLQSLGAFTIIIPFEFNLHLGLFLFSFGTGLYTPNMISRFAKEYLNKPTLMDSGFVIFTIAISVGAFIAPLVIGFIGETINWNLSFIIAGIFSLIAVLIAHFQKETQTITPDSDTFKKYGLKGLLIIFFLVSIINLGSEVNAISVHELLSNIENSSIVFSNSILRSYSLNNPFVIGLLFLAAFYWTKKYSSVISKLLKALLFTLIASIILFSVVFIAKEYRLSGVIIFFMLTSLVQILVFPLISSAITTSVNSKYLAIAFSLISIPTQILNYFVGPIMIAFEDREGYAPALTIALCIIGLLILIIWKKKQKDSDQNQRI